MSTLSMFIHHVKHWLEHELFFRINKIRKPREVLVIVAKAAKSKRHSRPRRHY